MDPQYAWDQSLAPVKNHGLAPFAKEMRPSAAILL